MKKKLLVFSAGLLCFASQVLAQVSFTANPNNGCAPLPVTFSNTSSTGNYYVWNFNDGTASVHVKNPVHTFNPGGNFNVNLTAFDTTGGGMINKGGTSMNINVNGGDLQVSGDSVCPGEVFTASINGTNANNYSWSFGDGSSSFQQNASHSYAAPGIDTLKVTFQNGCGGTQYLKRIITVKNGAHPSAQFGMNVGNGICPHDMVQFYPQNQNATSYLWNFGDASGTNTQSQPTHSYSNTGNFAVKLTVTSSCGTSSSWIDTVHVTGTNHFPNYSQIQSNSNMACPNDMVNFNYNVNAALNTVWKFGTGDSMLTSSASYAWTTTGTYTVTAKLTNGCGLDTVLSYVMTIKNNLPYQGGVQTQFSPNPACPNDVVHFQSNQADAYKWYFGDAAHDSSSVAQAQFSYPSTGTYTVTLKLYNGCGRDTAVTGTVTVNNSVVPTLSHTGNGNGNSWGAPASTSCPGDTVLFYAQATGALHWNFGDGSILNGGTPLYTQGGVAYIAKHVYTTNNTYEVKLTVTNGCGNSVTDSLPFTVGGSSPVNGSLNLVGNNSSNTCQPILMIGAGGSTYLWYFGNGDTLLTHAAQISYSYPTAGNYTITLKVTNGCGNSATYTQQMSITGMTPSLASTNLLCNGSAGGKIIASSNGGYMPYTFSLNGGPYQVSNTFNNLAAGTYTITIKDSAGCKVTSVATLNQPAALALAPGSVNSTCGSGNGSATATMSGGTVPYTYSWQAGGATATLANQHSGSYLITVTDANACTINATIAINDNSGPVVTYTGIQGPFCVNAGSFSLSGGTPTGGTYTGTGISAGSFFNPAAAGPGTHTINYSVTASGCTSSATNTIVVNALPHVTAFSVPANGSVCTGGSVTLSGGGATTYSWSGSASNNVAFDPTTSLTYTVSGTDGNNCTNTANVSITVNPYPTVTLSFAGHDTLGDCLSNVNLSGGTPAGGTYSGNGVAGSSFNPSAVGDGNYTITYSYTSSAGCMTSHSAALTVKPCPLGVQSLTMPGLKLYPNPSTGMVMIETPDQTGTLEVMNIIGQVLYSEKIVQTSHLLNLTAQPNGIYLVRVEGASGVAVQRIILNK